MGMSNEILERIKKAIRDEVIKKGFARVDYATTPKMKKGGRANTNKYYDRVKKLTQGVVSVGMSYEKALNNSKEKEHYKQGFETDYEPIQSKELRGMHWVDFPYLLQSNKDEEQFYIRLYLPKKNSKLTITWFVDGIEATQEQIDEFMPYVIEAKNDELEYFTKSIKLENILNLSQKNRLYV